MSGTGTPAWAQAARTVLRNSEAMVIGPTPPGTGVMAPATAAAPVSGVAALVSSKPAPVPPPLPPTRRRFPRAPYVTPVRIYHGQTVLDGESSELRIRDEVPGRARLAKQVPEDGRGAFADGRDPGRAASEPPLHVRPRLVHSQRFARGSRM